MFGRESDLSRLIDRLTSERVVTVTGTGGVGKTRVAGEAAARLASKGWRSALLDLAALRREEDVASSLATLLGVRPGPGQSPADAAADFLSGHRRTLLVVDNCEHVLPAARRLIDRLLDAAPGLIVLATSRVRLGVAAEVTVPLEPLTVDAANTNSSAVDMFLDRARRVRPDLGDSDEELALVTDLCRRLDGLPLALLTAHWTCWGRRTAAGATRTCGH
jgi:predicted ATPase